MTEEEFTHVWNFIPVDDANKIQEDPVLDVEVIYKSNIIHDVEIYYQKKLQLFQQISTNETIVTQYIELSELMLLFEVNLKNEAIIFSTKTEYQSNLTELVVCDSICYVTSEFLSE